MPKESPPASLPIPDVASSTNFIASSANLTAPGNLNYATPTYGFYGKIEPSYSTVSRAGTSTIVSAQQSQLGSNSVAGGPNLYISGLVPGTVNAQDIGRLLSEFGSVMKVSLHHDKHCAFAEMATAEEARNCLDRLKGRFLNGRRLSVYPSQKKSIEPYPNQIFWLEDGTKSFWNVEKDGPLAV